MISLSCVALLVFSAGATLSQSIPEDNAQLGVADGKPFGPYFCMARCAASCIDLGLASSVSECVEKLCPRADADTTCPRDDTECWQTCDRASSPDDKPAPDPITELNAMFARDENDFSASGGDPYTVRVSWQPVENATLYVVEAFPPASSDDNGVIRQMTTSPSYTFNKPDLCATFMVRVTSVNVFGISAPQYAKVNDWIPALYLDANFDVRSISYTDDEPHFVKVDIAFTAPDGWKSGDVRFADTMVRAKDCKGPLSGEAFASFNTTDDGSYTPIVYINETETSIQLVFPEDAIYAKCTFSYMVPSLSTRCNITVATSMPESNVGVGVDFELNCKTVENYPCPPELTDPPTVDTTTAIQPIVVAIDPSSGVSSDSNEGVVIIVPDTQDTTTAMTDSGDSGLEMTTTILPTTETVDTDEQSKSKDTPEDSSNPQPQENTDQPTTEEEVTTTDAPAVDSTEAPDATTTDALEVDSTEAPDATTTDAPEVDSTEAPDASTTEASIALDANESPDNGMAAVPVLQIEPRTTQTPVCTLAEFDVRAEVKKAVGQTYTIDLTVSWMEPAGFEVSSSPAFFIIRYGPILRTLIVDGQPDISNENIIRQPESTPNAVTSNELQRSLKLPNVEPTGLITFQICAIYDPDFEGDLPWELIRRYTVDLSAVKPDPMILAPQLQVPVIQTDDFGAVFDAFVHQMNNTKVTGPKSSEEKNINSDLDNSVEETATVQVDVAFQPPIIFNVDVKPVLTKEDESGRWSNQAFMLIMVMAFAATSFAAVVIFVLARRARGRRAKMQQAFHIPVEPGTNAVKVPLP